MHILNRKISNILFIVLLIIFVALKYEHLFLPHYWDESWSYATAVQAMYEVGPTLLPGKIAPEFTRGHPLLFYFLSSTWMQLFGDSLPSKHIFSLTISIIVLISIYYIIIKLFNNNLLALLAVAFWMIQSTFFVQSDRLLPEVLVALLTLWSLYCFSYKIWWALSISLTLLFFTKESGLVIGIGIGIAGCLLWLKDKSSNYLKYFIPSVCIPFLLIFWFFIYQKKVHGWYFFPEHIGFITPSLRDMLYKAIGFLNIKDVQVLLIGIIVSALLLLQMKGKRVFNRIFVRKNNETEVFFLAGTLTSLLYIGFCATNFFTIRYLMPVLLFGVLFFIALIELIRKTKGYKWSLFIFCIMCALQFSYMMTNQSFGDTSLNSISALKVQKKTINYIQQNISPDAYIALQSHHMRINLQNPACGFLNVSSGKKFENTIWEINNQVQYILFDNIEYDKRHQDISRNPAFDLKYRVEEKNCWSEVYLNKNYMKSN